MLKRLLRKIARALERRREMTIIEALARSDGKIENIPKFRTFPAKWE